MEVFPDEYVEEVTSPLAHKFYWWGFALLISYGMSGGDLLVWLAAFAVVLVVGRLLNRFVVARLFEPASEWWAGVQLRRQGWTKESLALAFRPSDKGSAETVKGGDIPHKGNGDRK